MSKGYGSPNLWWVQDSSTGAFSTLPPGPLLLPFVVLYGIVFLLSKSKDELTYRDNTPKKILENPKWKENEKRYLHLCKKSADCNNNLPFNEMMELNLLQSYIMNPHNICNPKHPDYLKYYPDHANIKYF